MTRYGIVVKDDLDDPQRTIIVSENDGHTWEPVALTDKWWAARIVDALKHREKFV